MIQRKINNSDVWQVSIDVTSLKDQIDRTKEIYKKKHNKYIESVMLKEAIVIGLRKIREDIMRTEAIADTIALNINSSGITVEERKELTAALTMELDIESRSV